MRGLGQGDEVRRPVTESRHGGRSFHGPAPWPTMGAPDPALEAPMSIRSLAALAALTLLASCSSPAPRGVTVGELFPTVTGTSLTGVETRFPDHVVGEPSVLIVAYVQDAQFDVDRWLLGLTQLGTPASVYEVPTIDGWFPTMFSGQIDSGMRAGIPEEDWRVVVTVYGDEAETITSWTGKDRPRSARVFLLDSDGRVAWFDDRGFSAGLAAELDATARGLWPE